MFKIVFSVFKQAPDTSDLGNSNCLSLGRSKTLVVHLSNETVFYFNNGPCINEKWWRLFWALAIAEGFSLLFLHLAKC